MKWIKSRPTFITEEAKIRDVILPKQAEEVRNVWGDKWLDLEEVDATEHIEQGKWKLDEEDKLSIFGIFFKSDMKEIYKLLGALPEKFSNVLKDSIDVEKIGDKAEVFDDTFDIRKATIDQMIFMYDNVFKKLSVSETKASEVILKDENGRPIMGEDNKIQKVPKEAGAPIYSSNLVNINSFITDYNRCYDEKASDEIFQSGHISRLVSYAKEDMNSGDYKYDTNIFGRDMHLQIEHKAKDILNISISKFFSSCQHLYTGGYRTNVLGNVFDTNSIPAFIKFDSKITHNGEIISDFLPLSRVMVRSVEEFNSQSKEPLIFFDRTYPDRMENEMKRIIEKYTKNKATEIGYNRLQYTYMPDVDISEEDTTLRQPYMDMISNNRVKKAKFIGKNTRKLYLNKEYDWSDIKISPKAKITELIIETTDIPENTFDIEMELEWIKFRYLKLKSISQFNIETDSYAFDKCSLEGNLFEGVSDGIKKLQFLSCEVRDLNLNSFTNLDELQLIYTLDNDTDLKDLLSQTTVKNLEISGDLMSKKENKSFIRSLKSNGVKVKIVGPVI